MSTTATKLLEDTLISWLPKQFQDEIRAAIANRGDWELVNFKEWSCIDQHESSEYFHLSEDQADRYPDGFWYHGDVYGPCLKVIDGTLHVGIEGRFDCGDEIDDACEYWTVTDLAEINIIDAPALLAFISEGIGAMAASGQEEYRQWCQYTGRDPYNFR